LRASCTKKYRTKSVSQGLKKKHFGAGSSQQQQMGYTFDAYYFGSRDQRIYIAMGANIEHPTEHAKRRRVYMAMDSKW